MNIVIEILVIMTLIKYLQLDASTTMWTWVIFAGIKFLYMLLLIFAEVVGKIVKKIVDS